MKKTFDLLAFRTYLKVWRRMHEYSQADVAKSSFIATSTYSFVENGDRMPTMNEFCALCDLMDVEPTDFFVSKEKVQRG